MAPIWMEKVNAQERVRITPRPHLAMTTRKFRREIENTFFAICRNTTTSTALSNDPIAIRNDSIDIELNCSLFYAHALIILIFY